MKILLIFLTLFFTNNVCTIAQDFFEDMNGEGIIVSNTSKTEMVARLNTSDASVKINLLGTLHEYVQPTFFRRVSVGGFLKGKSGEGFRALVKGDKLVPGFSFGGYFALNFGEKTIEGDSDPKIAFGHVIFSFSRDFGEYSILENLSSNNVLKQSFGYNKFSVSFADVFPIRRKDNLFLSGRLTVTKKSNLSELPSRKFVNERILFNQDSTNITKVISEQNVKVGKIKETRLIVFRPSVSYKPDNLENTAFSLYSDLKIEKANTLFGIGIGAFLLDKKHTFISNAGIHFELADLNNKKKEEVSFLSQYFRFGISTSINLFNQ